MANPIWNTLTPQFKNGDRKDGMVWMNGQWIPESTATPIMKPKQYNNNAGVPIEPAIVDKYKDNSTFMERLTAKDAKGNSTLGTIGDALIAIGSKGWGNAGLGDGAKVFMDGMNAKKSDLAHNAAINKAMTTINDANATPQAKMAAIQTAKESGADVSGLVGMVSASATGIKRETGYVTDPITGKTEYVDPNGSLDYQGDKAKLDSSIRVDETKQIDTNRQVIDEKAEATKQANLKEMAQINADIAKGVATQAQKDRLEELEAMYKGQASVAGVRGEQTTTRQATAYELKAANDTKKLQEKELPALENAALAADKVDNLFTNLLNLNPNQVEKTVGKYIAPVWLTGSEKILQEIESILVDSILAKLPPGAASNADVKMAKDAIVNRTTDAVGMNSIWDSAKAALLRERDQRRADLAEAKQILDYGVTEPVNNTPATQSTSTPSSTGKTDSGAKATNGSDASAGDMGN